MPRSAGTSAIRDRAEAVREAFAALLRSSSEERFTATEVLEELGRAFGRDSRSSTIREMWRLGRIELLESRDVLVETELAPSGPRILYRPVAKSFRFQHIPLVLRDASSGEFWGPSSITREEFELFARPWKFKVERIEREWREVVTWRRAHPGAQAKEAAYWRDQTERDRVTTSVANRWKWHPDSEGVISGREMERYNRAVEAELRQKRRRTARAEPPSIRSMGRRKTTRSRVAAERLRRARPSPSSHST